MYLNDDDFYSPLSMFSIMYLGYAIGGFYYSGATHNFGKFVGFLNLQSSTVVDLMRVSLIYAIICFLCFGVGYSLFKEKVRFKDSFSINGFWCFYVRYYRILVIPFLIVGLVYWYWIAHVTAGGMLNMLMYFQAFRHLVEDANVSTLPYHFYYAGIYLWLLAIHIKGEPVTKFFLFCSIVGLVINLSQGRITLAITFLFSQMFFFALKDENLRKKVFIYFISLMSFAFVVYFLRMLSNSLFIGADGSALDKNIFEVIIGGGNVADLQQLVIIFHTYSVNEANVGLTYFDWIRNTLGQFFGMKPSSIGLTIKQLYVPESSGAPTPGAIGEAYVNFNIAGPLFMFFVGLAFTFIYKYVMKSGSPLLLLIYSIFLARFIFIYPKVDSTMFINFLWGATPFLLGVGFIFILFELAKGKKINA
ncbi:O-antigen polymerase [Pseudoalteromonas sp. NEC-BIFX-2020_015]|uniref:O-antigen polymerase n=1 Tax=Pseudoalteromonas sp. NEC-BIFX-2020_015 TaxID=2729544 RepID=UPI0014615567|nr:O-antigen polymerase [Pseudoalteromonas sp. NEC-BIFX-2020_015]